MTSAGALREPLERLYREFDWGARDRRCDAIRFPLRYAAPADREVVALLASCLAYGRVDCSRRGSSGCSRAWATRRRGSCATSTRGQAPALRRLPLSLQPAARPRGLLRRDAGHARVATARWARLRRRLRAGRRPSGAGPRALRRGVPRTATAPACFPRGRFSYGYRHWFPAAVDRRGLQAPAPLPALDGPARAARLRPLDPVPPARLLIPWTRTSRTWRASLGLTRRRSRNWQMAEEITRRLRRSIPAIR